MYPTSAMPVSRMTPRQIVEERRDVKRDEGLVAVTIRLGSVSGTWAWACR